MIVRYKYKQRVVDLLTYAREVSFSSVETLLEERTSGDVGHYGSGL